MSAITIMSIIGGRGGGPPSFEDYTSLFQFGIFMGKDMIWIRFMRAPEKNTTDIYYSS